MATGALLRPVRLVLGAALLLASAAASAEDFPRPASLEPAIGFWKRVYLGVTTAGGLIHDAEHLSVVYEVVRFAPMSSEQSRSRLVKQRRQHWASVLRALGRGRAPESPSEKEAAAALGAALGRAPTRADYDRAALRLRFQRGQRDRFRDGLIRSGAWEAQMRAVFRRRGMPEDLAYLPHVESSFNPAAYSRYGAAGVWQFMRSTGRRFLTVGYEIDERLDPLKATEAAATLLRENWLALGKHWPLAITAYNHGTGGLQRARRSFRTSDIGVIVQRYRSRRFGFASRNFYAQFLAARDIARDWETHFGSLPRDTPEPVEEVTLPFFADVAALQSALGVTSEAIRRHNPALRPPVFRSGKRIPRGYVLRLPAGAAGDDPAARLAALPEAQRHPEQYHARYYQVRRGDTLARIAGRHGTTTATLVALNDLAGTHRIIAGQILQLPDRGSARGEPAPPRRSPPVVRTADAAAQAEPAPAPAAADVAQAEPAPAPAADVGEAKPAPAPILAPPPALRPADAIPVEHRTTVVDAGETLGHFADWLEVPTQRLRTLNRLSHRRSIHEGQRLRLDFSRVTPETFTERRLEHHKAIEEDFFGSYRVTGTVQHTLERGENAWTLAHQRYSVPVWLLERHNPGVDLTRLAPGAVLTIPVVESAGS